MGINEVSKRQALRGGEFVDGRHGEHPVARPIAGADHRRAAALLSTIRRTAASAAAWCARR
jgi:hypothetical protein